MKILAGLIVLLLLALTAGPRLQGRFNFSRRFILVGGEFLLLGWALGGQGLGLLDDDTLRALRPLLILGLGWIGLLVGLQFEMPILRRIPASFWGVGLFQSLATFLLLFISARILLAQALPMGGLVESAAFLLAAAGADSSQHILGLVSREKEHAGHLPLHLYRFCAELDNLVPIFALALLPGLIPMSASGTPGWLPALQGFGLATMLGILLGILLNLLKHRVNARSHHLLVLIGFLAFSGGIAQALGLPPLYVNFVAGIVSVNFFGHRRDTWRLALASEQPFYFMFLVLVGAGWHGGDWWAFALAPVFFLLRILFRILGLAAGGAMVFGRRRLLPSHGLILSGQGSASVALVASLEIMRRSSLVDNISTVILLGFLLSAMFCPSLSAWGLTREKRP